MPEYHLDCSLTRETRATLDDFTFAYIEAFMWLLTDDDDGSPLDYLGLHDVHADTIKQAIEDCKVFREQAGALLDEAGSDAQNGHDFYLTRNRHGAGFWDRGYPSRVGQTLTDLAHGWGETYHYLGDDGMVHQS